MPTTVRPPVTQLERALSGLNGELIQVERIEFERIAENQIRWSLFAGGRLLYTATDRPGNLVGWLTCTSVLLGAGSP